MNFASTSIEICETEQTNLEAEWRERLENSFSIAVLVRSPALQTMIDALPHFDIDRSPTSVSLRAQSAYNNCGTCVMSCVSTSIDCSCATVSSKLSSRCCLCSSSNCLTNDTSLVSKCLPNFEIGRYSLLEFDL